MSPYICVQDAATTTSADTKPTAPAHKAEDEVVKKDEAKTDTVAPAVTADAAKPADGKAANVDAKADPKADPTAEAADTAAKADSKADPTAEAAATKPDAMDSAADTKAPAADVEAATATTDTKEAATAKPAADAKDARPGDKRTTRSGDGEQCKKVKA